MFAAPEADLHWESYLGGLSANKQDLVRFAHTKKADAHLDVDEEARTEHKGVA